MRKRGKKQLAILLSAALVMQGQAAYGASLKKTGETIQEATSEITAAEGEAAVPGDDEADDSNDGNEKVKGELRLSVTEEDQIAFEEIEVMLPAEVTASVSVEDEESEDVEEDAEEIKNIEDTAKMENGLHPGSLFLRQSCRKSMYWQMA